MVLSNLGQGDTEFEGAAEMVLSNLGQGDTEFEGAAEMVLSDLDQGVVEGAAEGLEGKPGQTFCTHENTADGEASVVRQLDSVHVPVWLSLYSLCSSRCALLCACLSLCAPRFICLYYFAGCLSLCASHCVPPAVCPSLSLFASRLLYVFT